MLTAFGTFWAGEGIRIATNGTHFDWPAIPIPDVFIIILAAIYLLASYILVQWLKSTKQRQTIPSNTEGTQAIKEEVIS